MEALAVEAGQAARLEGMLDRAAEEVFGTMMGIPCGPVEWAEVEDRETVSAVIGLAGAMSGSMILRSEGQAAMRMAEYLTGVAPDEVDALVRDAAGEVCNMIAGAWKGFDPMLSSGCLLSTPTVVAGSSYQLFSQRATLRIERRYRFGEMHFTVTVCCEFPR
ncbi:MAG TPA: chemotaxis protein CheX [Acidobacteriaceae bacterium]|jgi:chemotaxis protein CheX|nr:chemotaxis protein CheX [Acidobacteriaceae bacterium]